MGRLATPSHFPHWELPSLVDPMSLTNFLPETSEANAPIGTVNSTSQNDSRPTHQIRHSKITRSKVSCNKPSAGMTGTQKPLKKFLHTSMSFHPTDRRKPSCTPLVFVPPSLSGRLHTDMFKSSQRTKTFRAEQFPQLSNAQPDTEPRGDRQ